MKIMQKIFYGLALLFIPLAIFRHIITGQYRSEVLSKGWHTQNS